jgi:hypothetical protein
MADSWQTIEQAAVSLRLSVRTINRHISSGKLQSRLNSDGRREVLVGASESATTSPFSDTPASDMPLGNDVPFVSPTPASSAQPMHGISLDADRVLALADSATQKADMAVSAYQTLARLADTQVCESRRQTRLAWGLVAVMAIGVTVAVGWTTHRLTRTAGELERLRHDVAGAVQANQALTDTTDKLRSQTVQAEHTLQAELLAAKEEAARAHGQLAAYRERAEHVPASTPSPNLDAMLSAIRNRFARQSEHPATQPTVSTSEQLSD